MTSEEQAYEVCYLKYRKPVMSQSSLHQCCLVKAIAVHIQNKFTQMLTIMTLFKICSAE